VSGNGYIISRWGFGDRWDAYRNHIHDGGGVTGEAILNKALASVEGKKEPWFLYVGTIDTHVSWRAKEPWFSRYDSKPYDGRFKTEASGVDVEKIIAGKLAVTERDKERVRAIYDSNVSYQDKLVGDLMAALEKWGIADETMVIITADHGDELWEQGKVGHGQSLHEILVRVPLLIHYPALFRPGVYSEGVEVIDIVPTLADAFDIDLDPEWQGESLLALINGRGLGYPRLSMASMYEYWHVGRVGPWKLYTSGRQTPRLYRIDDDLFEAKDLAGEQPFAVRLVSDALWTLRTFNREWRKSQWGSPANLSADFGRAVGP
jgi:arylsulfatase A-like enzyme